MAETSEQPTMSKREAGYRKSTDPDERCGNCSMYVRPDGCTLVVGKIRPNDYCEYWEAKRK